MAALAQAYPTGDCGCGRRAAAEEIVRMLPDLRSFIPGRKLLMVRKVAVRFPSMEARQSSSLIASSGPGLLKLPPPFRDEDVDRTELFLRLRPHRFDLGEAR